MLVSIIRLYLNLALLYFLGAWLLHWPLPDFSLC
jgi:hypothetical protein